MECLYYERGNDNAIICNLCPHNCVIKEGNVGICRVRKNSDGKLIALNYGRITSYAYDPIEKKPLYHFYPGKPILSIGSYGCNLACDFCQNWEIAHDERLTMEIDKEDILLLSSSGGSIGIAYTYNEPSMSYEYIKHISKVMRKHGLKNVMVTNGYINEGPLIELLPYIDAMNIDLKAMTDEFYRRICKGSLKPVQETIKRAVESTHVELTTLIIEGENSSDEEMEALGEWIANIDEDIPLHLSKYHPAYKMKLPETKYEVLMRAKDITKKYLNHVYIGNVWGVDNNTYCPHCHNRLINRYSTAEIVGIKDNNCTKCGNEVNIIY
ncbi:MAG: AmmeMemoRadiSam system radical SAM enzyme [Tissierellia bacterium]|nr:AmmeMemoRadiSam system radical SAM enzyme [Tissierellia bacterium]